MVPDLSIIIVNYNAKAKLVDCLTSIRHNSPDISVEVIVVDNGSKDGSVEIVENSFPEVVCIANGHNAGYTKANNQGLEIARGRYLMLLNNDTVVKSGALLALTRFLDAQPGVGAVSPRVLNPDGSTQGTFKNLPTPAAALWGRRSILTRLFPGNRFSRQYLIYRSADFRQPFPVGSAATCALVVTRSAFEAAGGLDEGYAMYWVDVDWCKAIWDCGLQVYIEPAAEIVHYEHSGGSRAGFRQSWRSITGFHQGAYRYYRKYHVGSAWSLRHLLVITGLSARALLVLTVSQGSWLIRRLSEVTRTSSPMSIRTEKP